MSSVRKSDEVVALAVADIHLCHRRPSARADEGWYGVMRWYLRALSRLQARYEVPILCAGDVFDYWAAPPELINFAINNLPTMYAIPGQHDLPWHGYEEQHRSAYATLVYADRIEDLGSYSQRDRSTQTPFIYQLRDRDYWLAIYPFPWGYVPYARSELQNDDRYLHIALMHRYVWCDGTGHPGADPAARVEGWGRVLSGYDVVITGDNHTGFTAKAGLQGPTRPATIVYNCGALIPRAADERTLRPAVGLVMADGRVERHYLEGYPDAWADDPPVAAGARGAVDLAGFLSSLGNLATAATDFRETLRRAANAEGAAPDLRQFIQEVLDVCRE